MSTSIVKNLSEISEETAGNFPVNILLVDDREENLISLESLLEQEGRVILKASGGNEALRIALEQEIGLILLDVQMPDIDGFEVARLLKENSKTKDIAIIFVTAISKEEKFALMGFEGGAVDYLHKPLDTNLVKAKVNVFEKLYRQRVNLNLSNEKLANINRQLDEFVYIVSHDLKAPLRGLMSLATFLAEELGANPPKEVTDLLNMMKSRTERMQGLIDGILHYSRMGNNRGEKESVDLKALLNSIIDLVCPPDHVTFEIADNLPVLRAEMVKLHEVFQNLILNAIKYNSKEKVLIKISCVDKEDFFEFLVTDNGNGIKPEHFEKIFGIFQTLQPRDQSESTGIGLTIVKKIVEQNGGKVIVESIYGEGSTFKVLWKK